DAAARFDNVADDRDRPEDSTPHATGDADDAALAIANGRDAVQRALDAGAIVVAERADALHDVVDVFLGHRVGRQQHLAPGQSRLGLAAEVHHHFEQLTPILQRFERIADM